MSVWKGARLALSLKDAGLGVICEGVGLGLSFWPLFSDVEESLVSPKISRMAWRS